MLALERRREKVGDFRMEVSLDLFSELDWYRVDGVGSPRSHSLAVVKSNLEAVLSHRYVLLFEFENASQPCRREPSEHDCRRNSLVACLE